jgi:hypothetical protein
MVISKSIEVRQALKSLDFQFGKSVHSSVICIGKEPKMIKNDALFRLKNEYPRGTRVELLSMDDPYTILRPRDQGTVTDIDDTGTIFVSWDRGSSLGLVYGIDHYRKVESK